MTDNKPISIFIIDDKAISCSGYGQGMQLFLWKLLILFQNLAYCCRVEVDISEPFGIWGLSIGVKHPVMSIYCQLHILN